MLPCFYFSYKNGIDSLQKAFIHPPPPPPPPEPCEARFIMDAHALFDVFWTVEQKHPPTPILMLGRARNILKVTPIGFVWKKKVIYT